jgi:hypothetical protein
MAVSCIDEYWPDTKNKYTEVLVVDGVLTNLPGPYIIKLSLSTNLDSPYYNPVTQASVSIWDNMGNKEELIETVPGTYVTHAEDFSGIIGRKYKLEIQTNSGKYYESDFEELLAPVGIDSVYAEIEYQQVENGIHDKVGYQFYLDTEIAEQDTNYYFWRISSTYKYNSDYYTRYIYDHGLIPFPDADSIYTCWLTHKIEQLYTYKTENLSQPKLERIPLNYESTESRALSIRYSLMVDQFTIDSDAFQYWDDLREQSSQQDNIYTTQPYQIRGNMFNPNDLGEPVLGYFMVSGQAQQRIYVNRPPATIPFYYPICELDDGDYDAYKYIGWTDPRSWPLYVTEDLNGHKALPPQDCIDCRQKGGTILAPEFWTDN